MYFPLRFSPVLQSLQSLLTCARMKLRIILTSLLLFQYLERSRVRGDTASECKVIGQKLMKQQLKTVTDCSNSLKLKDSKEKKAKASCIMKCVMEKLGMVDTNGKVDKERGIKFLKENLGSLWEKMEGLMSPCQEFMHNLDPKEEYCKSYDPMIKCGTAAFMALCKFN